MGDAGINSLQCSEELISEVRKVSEGNEGNTNHIECQASHNIYSRLYQHQQALPRYCGF